MKIVHKISCASRKKFHAKVTSRVHSEDLGSTNVEGLIGSLTIYKKKYKEMTLKAEANNDVKSSNDGLTDETVR